MSLPSLNAEKTLSYNNNSYGKIKGSNLFKMQTSNVILAYKEFETSCYYGGDEDALKCICDIGRPLSQDECFGCSGQWVAPYTLRCM